MQLVIDNDFQQKIMRMGFAQPETLGTNKDVLRWRQEWMQALKTWHSPYKLVVDCSNLSIADAPEMKAELERMLKFFNGLFLRKAVGFGFDASKHHELLPFEVVATQDEAEDKIGIRIRNAGAEPSDFRSSIQLENHFQQHVIELSFKAPVVMATKADVAALKSKLMNNLMQWHSKWSLIVDCTNLKVDPVTHPDFQLMERFFRGLFMKEIVGYSPSGDKTTYPFEVFRARHKAAAKLEGEGTFSGDEANCRSRGTSGT